MAIGVEKASVDLDSIFALYTSGRTKAAATGIRYGSSDIDLNQRYENIIYGTGPSATGIKTNSADLNTKFCTIASDWSASLPSFPHPFTQTPEPYPSGTLPMTVTLTGGPGGSYTYSWTRVNGLTAHFVIVSGNGTATIQWYATGVSGEPDSCSVTCTVTATSGAQVSATTVLTFNVPGGH